MLSLASKSLLAWLVFGGTFQPNGNQGMVCNVTMYIHCITQRLRVGDHPVGVTVTMCSVHAPS